MEQQISAKLAKENKLRFLENQLLNPWLEGPYPSVGLSKCFLGIGLLAFSKFWHGVRKPYEVIHNRGKIE